MTATAPVEVIPEITFMSGLPAFPDAHRFAIVRWGDEDSPFSVLRCIDQPELAFVVTHPILFFPDYSPEIDDDTAARISLDEPEDAIVLVILTLGGSPSDATANLLGPIVINQHTREAIQAVLYDTRYDVSTPLHP
ncbi:MAG: flagellar assembly protein FliW [Acidimicrobiia bacterium]